MSEQSKKQIKVFLKAQSIEELLARRNLSHEAFCDKVMITPTHLSLLKDPEKNNASPSPKLRERMLQVLNDLGSSMGQPEVLFDDIFFVQNGRLIEHSAQDQSVGQPAGDRSKSPV